MAIKIYGSLVEPKYKFVIFDIWKTSILFEINFRLMDTLGTLESII